VSGAVVCWTAFTVDEVVWGGERTGAGATGSADEGAGGAGFGMTELVVDCAAFATGAVTGDAAEVTLVTVELGVGTVVVT
jgi:hypothetical protein